MNRSLVLLAVLSLVSPGCASQKMSAIFEQLGDGARGPAVVYNFAYARKSGGANAALLTDRTLVTSPSTDGEAIMTIPGVMFEVEFPAGGAQTLTKSLPASGTEVVWVRRGLWQVEAMLDGSGGWIGEKHYWDVAYDLMVDAYSRQGAGEDDYGLVAIEPSYAAENAGYVDKAIAYLEDLTESAADLPEGATTAVVADPSTVWPGRGFAWHLGSEYSELSGARQALASKAPPPYDVRIAHLDTGYFPGDRLKPRNLLAAESKNFTQDGSPQGDIPGTESTHGARTLSTLAGGRATVADPAGSTLFDADIGAFPEARVAEYRISRTLPIHINASQMAEAIFTAADTGFDVVSISAGGLPSLLQRDAVNFAYENGTAVVAATGDFFTVPVLGLSTPKSVVFPARYNRVLGVAGVTAAGKSYGLAPCHLCLLTSDAWKSWGLRGSYGPSCEMAGHTIAGYAPNVTHSAACLTNTNAIALTGAGTSHATPQVAAAAALWLEYHRDDLQGASPPWKKTEAVYTALLRSADNTSLEDYSVRTMGEGTLKALRALNTEVDLQTLCHREPSTVGLRWVKDVLFGAGVPGGYDERLTAFLKEMLFTEVQQLMFRSEKVTAVLEELRFADDPGGCEHRPVLQPSPGDSDRARRLIEALPKSDMSRRLREALNARLQSL